MIAVRIVGVEEADVFASGVVQSCIAGLCGPAIRALLNNTQVICRLLQLFRDRKCIVGGFIVNDYDLSATDALFENR